MLEMPLMTPSKPYLLRAIYEWIVDNQCTPYVLVAAEAPGVVAPEGIAEQGQLVLNLSPAATRHLTISNETICFETRFSGVPHQLVIPAYAVLAIYAQENGQGMSFEPELWDTIADEPDVPDEPPPPPPKPGGRPSLRVVK